MSVPNSPSVPGPTSLPSAAGTPADAVEVTRSEEHVIAGTTRHVTGRVRIGKRIVTEQRTVTVTVRREEFYLEELPVDALQDTGQAPAAGPDREVVISLRQEIPHITTQLEPLELVKVRVHATTQNETATADVAREVVDVIPPAGSSTSGATDAPYRR